VASQHWLGTTIAVSDTPDRNAADEERDPGPAARWLAGNGWQYGFIMALPETPLGRRLGYEPWRIRWVGRELAAQLRSATPGSADYATRVTEAMQRAELELAAVR
jgi:LAS superfamily LD-carboxypeptidase LdcB